MSRIRRDGNGHVPPATNLLCIGLDMVGSQYGTRSWFDDRYTPRHLGLSLGSDSDLAARANVHWVGSVLGGNA